MLELLQRARRDPARSRATSCGRKFREFDIECVDVLIGKPDTAEAGGKIETLLEQLRLRQLSHRAGRDLSSASGRRPRSCGR